MFQLLAVALKLSRKNRVYFRAFFALPAPIRYIEHRSTNLPYERSIIHSLLVHATVPALLLLAMRTAYVAGS